MIAKSYLDSICVDHKGRERLGLEMKCSKRLDTRVCHKHPLTEDEAKLL